MIFRFFKDWWFRELRKQAEEYFDSKKLEAEITPYMRDGFGKLHIRVFLGGEKILDKEFIMSTADTLNLVLKNEVQP